LLEAFECLARETQHAAARIALHVLDVARLRLALGLDPACECATGLDPSGDG
jgi:hypothetical protein